MGNIVVYGLATVKAELNSFYVSNFTHPSLSKKDDLLWYDDNEINNVLAVYYIHFQLEIIQAIADKFFKNSTKTR